MAHSARESRESREPSGVPAPRSVRLAEVVGSLSLATDLGNGQPLETALACTVVAMDLARAHGLGVEDLDAVYWAGLLRFVGCTSTSVEESQFSGDDLELRAALLGADLADPGDVAQRIAGGLGRALDPGQRALAAQSFLEHGPRLAPVVLTAHCDVAVRLASRLGMPPSVTASLAAYHERWDGLGLGRLQAEAIPLSARVLGVAEVALANARSLGADELRTTLRRRAGGQLDPEIVSTFLREDRRLLATIGGESAWERAMALEPGARRTVPDGQLVELARVLGDYADLKSPFTLGHSRAVARLAVEAAALLGLPASQLPHLEAAALVHDLGRASVPNGILDKPGPLNALERERARSHAYYTERILALAPALAPLARLAASSHERLDGSGYPHGLSGAALGPEARLLAAADAYQGLLEERAYRRACTHDRAAKRMTEGARQGRFDVSAVVAVLEVADQDARAPRRARGSAGAPRASRASRARAARTWPAQLTDREVEVLRLVARGLTNKQVAARLGVSPRTVQQHTLHIYDKIGVSTRAAATLFAAEHDLFAIVWR